MKNILVLIVVCFSITTLNSCKSEEEKNAERIHQQEIKDVSNTKRAGDKWNPPGVNVQKTDKAERK